MRFLTSKVPSSNLCSPESSVKVRRLYEKLVKEISARCSCPSLWVKVQWVLSTHTSILSIGSDGTADREVGR